MKTLWTAFLLIGCAWAQTGTFAERDPHYKLQPEDKVEVQYRYTPEYNGTVALQPDGYVSLPLIGEVKLSGKTLEQARVAIVAKAAERLADPEVTVLLKEYVKPYFVVAGEVARPGLALGHKGLVRDLGVQAAGVAPGGLRVEIVALDERDLDAFTRQIIGGRAPGQPAADDQHVGLHLVSAPGAACPSVYTEYTIF